MTRTKLAAVALLILACDRSLTVHVASSTKGTDTAIPKSVTDTPNRAIGEPDSVVGDADDEYVPPISDSTAFSCAPKTLGPRDTLTFQMETPHGGELFVRTPEDIYFYLVYPQPGDTIRKNVIMPSENFKGMSLLKVAADVRLPPRVYGRDSVPEPVFSRRGDYVVMMGENLESDHTGPPFICTVTFTP